MNDNAMNDIAANSLHELDKSNTEHVEKKPFENVIIQLVQKVPYEITFITEKDLMVYCLGFEIAESSFNGSKKTIIETRPGTISFVPKGTEVYTRNIDRAGEIVCIHTEPSMRTELTEEYNHDPFTEYRKVADSDAPSIANLARKLIHSGDSKNRIAAESIALLSLSCAYRGAFNSDIHANKQGLSDEKLKEVFEYINTNYADDVSLDTLAKLCGLTRFQFSRLFKKQTGFSPYQYILDHRLDMAKELILNSELPLTDIAYEVGFSSQAHMTDIFKRKLSITPAKLRNES